MNLEEKEYSYSEIEKYVSKMTKPEREKLLLNLIAGRHKSFANKKACAENIVTLKRVLNAIQEKM